MFFCYYKISETHLFCAYHYSGLRHYKFTALYVGVRRWCCMSSGLHHENERLYTLRRNITANNLALVRCGNCVVLLLQLFFSAVLWKIDPPIHTALQSVLSRLTIVHDDFSSVSGTLHLCHFLGRKVKSFVNGIIRDHDGVISRRHVILAPSMLHACLQRFFCSERKKILLPFGADYFSRQHIYTPGYFLLYWLFSSSSTSGRFFFRATWSSIRTF